MQAFLYDFEAGNSTEAQRIIHSRRTGASSALSAAAFFVSRADIVHVYPP